MNLYLITRKGSTGYDEYDSAVVVAASAQAARKTHPSSGEIVGADSGTWVGEADVEVEYLGVASAGRTAGVVCGSFNGG